MTTNMGAMLTTLTTRMEVLREGTGDPGCYSHLTHAQPEASTSQTAVSHASARQTLVELCDAYPDVAEEVRAQVAQSILRATASYPSQMKDPPQRRMRPATPTEEED